MEGNNHSINSSGSHHLEGRTKEIKKGWIDGRKTIVQLVALGHIIWKAGRKER